MHAESLVGFESTLAVSTFYSIILRDIDFIRYIHDSRFPRCFTVFVKPNAPNVFCFLKNGSFDIFSQEHNNKIYHFYNVTPTRILTILT